MLRTSRLLFPVLAGLLLLGSVTSACSGSRSGAGAGHDHPMAALEQLPADVQTAPVAVRQAYQFAVANPEVLEALPCYCGCGAMGHTSNYACYVAGVDATGAITFDPHALGCSICVDITQDAMRLLDQGQSLVEIRSYVDTTYARYGPSNIP